MKKIFFNHLCPDSICNHQVLRNYVLTRSVEIVPLTDVTPVAKAVSIITKRFIFKSPMALTCSFEAARSTTHSFLMRVLPILLLILSCLSCKEAQRELISHSEGISVVSLKELNGYQAIDINGTATSIAEELLTGVDGLLRVDGYLILTRFYAQPHYLSIISLKDTTLAADFLREGGRPGEYAGIVLFSVVDFKRRTLGICPKGYASSYAEVSIDSILTNPDYQVKKRTRFDTGYGLMDIAKFRMVNSPRSCFGQRNICPF